MTPSWALVKRQGQLNQTIPLIQLPCLVGRQSVANLYLEDAHVSGAHAVLYEEQHELCVKDLESTNGTFINGNKVEGEARVRAGDLVQFGETVFEIRRIEAHAESLRTQSSKEVKDWALALAQFEKLITQEGAIKPHYQPIVSVNDDRAAAYEVLARARIAGLQSAPEMFKAAAQLNREVELSQAIRLAGLGAKLGSEPSPLFLNTHPAELQDLRSLIVSLRSLRLAHPSLPITLEVHEAAVTNLRQMQMLRLALSDLNMQLAYDDFGVGQSRLAELAETQPDCLKFDINLVRDLHRASLRKQNIVANLVRLAKRLGAAPLAEGVESEQEASICRQIGFELMQGYYFGRPASASQCFPRETSCQSDLLIHDCNEMRPGDSIDQVAASAQTVG